MSEEKGKFYHRPCSPSDYCKDGKCGRNGCYEATVDDRLKKDK